MASMNRQVVKTAAIIIIVFVASALAARFIFNRPSSPPASQPPPASSPAAETTAQSTQSPVQSQQSPANVGGDDDSFFSRIFDTGDVAQETVRSEGWATVFARVALRLTLAALLTAILAFRPRKSAVLFKRNLFVAQTQILLAVVGSALMMIVGDSAARAFGIFAAVSLVRFRTNIRDPKEITVLLVSLAVGLATGVGRWELGVILSLFVLGLLWVLEYREPEMTFRPMELKIRTRSLVETHKVIRTILHRYKFDSELRTLNREDDKDPFACIVFFVEVSPLVSTDELSAEILSTDRDNIDSIEWSQQKNSANVYQ
jgi:uncharacterized membrane protein YhiD involved in acid resistance